MALYEDIENEINNNRLKTPWTTSDLLACKNLRAKYTDSTLRTAPPNQSISLPGISLGNGNNASIHNFLYYRVDKVNNALCYALPVHINETLKSLRDATKPSDLDVTPDEDLPEGIVESDYPMENEVNNTAQPITNTCERRKILEQLVADINNEQRWDERLLNYTWKGRSFFQTQDDIADLLWRGSLLTRLVDMDAEWTNRDNDEAVKWAEQIFAWGGTRQREAVTAEKIRSNLTNSVNSVSVFRTAPMNSGYTKVASFATAYLEEATGQTRERLPQVIYDSRVAASLISRLENILIAKGVSDTQSCFPGLGYVDAARGGTRPRQRKLKWPNGYRSWAAQFIATNIVAEIRDILNNSEYGYPSMPSRDGSIAEPCAWTIRGIEAVLFMDGY